MFNSISISDLRKFDQSQSVWVLNTTSSCPTMQRNIDPDTGKWKQERADVIINVNSAVAGERESIVIPQSFLPVDVTEYVSVRDLLECRAFLKAVREGLITVIDEDSAMELFNTPGADRERFRLKENERKLRDLSAARGITKSEVINISNPSDNSFESLPTREVRTITEIEPSEDDDFDPTFVANVLKWTQMDDTSVLNEMRIAGKFTRKQLKYCISKLDPKKHATVIARIKSTMKGKKNEA